MLELNECPREGSGGFLEIQTPPNVLENLPREHFQHTTLWFPLHFVPDASNAVEAVAVDIIGVQVRVDGVVAVAVQVDTRNILSISFLQVTAYLRLLQLIKYPYFHSFHHLKHFQYDSKFQDLADIGSF